MASVALTIALSWTLGGLMHFWPRFPGSVRRLLSVALNAAGLAFLLAGTAAEGLREVETTSLVVVGPSYLTATSSASASLHYYVLTAVCLLLGFGGLVFSEPLARWLSRHWLTSATTLAWLITVLRFLLEKSAAPHLLTQVVGITWMAPVVGAFFAVSLREEGRTRRDLVRPLVAYAFMARAFVVLAAVLATRLQLGTHYDVSPLIRITFGLTGAEHVFTAGSWSQLVWLSFVPQLVVWPIYTVVAGLAGGLLAWRFVPRNARRRRAASLSPEGLVSDPGGPE